MVGDISEEIGGLHQLEILQLNDNILLRGTFMMGLDWVGTIFEQSLSIYP